MAQLRPSFHDDLPPPPNGTARANRRPKAWQWVWSATLSLIAAALFGACGGGKSFTVPASGKTAPTEVRLTWFGVSNWTFKIADLNILTDGYMTRIPQNYFSGGGGGLATTKAAYPIDKASIDKVNGVLSSAPGSPVNLILTGHSHFDHSFDTPYWAKLTGAHIIGSKTTCLQARALGVPAEQCTAVYGGEKFELNQYVTMRVVRWNHSGSHETNPEQHDPVELQAVPTPDASGNLRGGVAEDFPNGGGNRGYLFTVKTAGGQVLTFYDTNSGAPQDLTADSVTDGVNYGKPVDSLSKAMQDAALNGVDLWIGAGGQPVASLAVPIVKPRFFVQNHLGSFFLPFTQGDTTPFSDTNLANYLASNNVTHLPPKQYLDAWVLDPTGFRMVENAAMKQPYGF